MSVTLDLTPTTPGRGPSRRDSNRRSEGLVSPRDFKCSLCGITKKADEFSLAQRGKGMTRKCHECCALAQMGKETEEPQTPEEIKMKSLQAQVTKQNEEQEHLRTELVATKATLSQLEKEKEIEIADYQEKINGIQEELNKNKSQVDSLSTQNQDYQNQIKDLTEQSSKLKSQISELEHQIQTLTTQNQALSTHRAETAQQISKENQEISSLQATIEQLTKDKQSLLQKQAELTKVQKDTLTQVSLLTGEKTKLQQQVKLVLDTSEAAHQTLQKEIQQLKAAALVPTHKNGQNDHDGDKPTSNGQKPKDKHPASPAPPTANGHLTTDSSPLPPQNLTIEALETQIQNLAKQLQNGHQPQPSIPTFKIESNDSKSLVFQLPSPPIEHLQHVIQKIDQTNAKLVELENQTSRSWLLPAVFGLALGWTAYFAYKKYQEA